MRFTLRFFVVSLLRMTVVCHPEHLVILSAAKDLIRYALWSGIPRRFTPQNDSGFRFLVALLLGMTVRAPRNDRKAGEEHLKRKNPTRQKTHLFKADSL